MMKKRIHTVGGAAGAAVGAAIGFLVSKLFG